MSNEAATRTEDLDYLLALSLACEEEEAHLPQQNMGNESDVHSMVALCDGFASQMPNILEDLQDNHRDESYAPSDIDSECSVCLDSNDPRAKGKEQKIQKNEEKGPSLVGLQITTSAEIPASVDMRALLPLSIDIPALLPSSAYMPAPQDIQEKFLASIVPPPRVAKMDFPDEQDESSASDHTKTSWCPSIEYSEEGEDSDEDEDDYSFASLDDDCDDRSNQESSDTIRSGSSFEFVFQGIDSVEDITLEYIERCISFVDMEQIVNQLAKDSSKNNGMLDAACRRLLILGEQESRKKNGGDDGVGDDFVVVAADIKSIGSSTETVTETAKTKEISARKITSKSVGGAENAVTIASTASVNKKKAPSINPIYPDLTSKNLRSAIVIYSREHPDDLGMPMKKLMKFFGINKRTSSKLKNEFKKIVNQECLLESSDELGRVLFLKEADTQCGSLDKQYQDVVDEENRVYASIMNGIENCNSIKELRSYIDELRKSNINLPDHLAAAEERIKTISRKTRLTTSTTKLVRFVPSVHYDNSDEDEDENEDEDEDENEDVEFRSDQVPHNINSLTIEYIENCRDIPELFEIVNYFGRFGHNDSRRMGILPSRHNGLYGAAIKRLNALGFETSKTSRGQASKSASSGINSKALDRLLALSLCLEMNEDKSPDKNVIRGIFKPCLPRMQISNDLGNDLGFSGFGARGDNISYRIHLSPNFYYYDDTVAQLQDFLDLSYSDPICERNALDYIEQCNFIPELRGIMHFCEEPQNFQLGQSLINSAEIRIQTILGSDPLASIHLDCYSFNSDKRKNWLVFDSDIQLTSGIQRMVYKRSKNAEWQRGNAWLLNVVTRIYDLFSNNEESARCLKKRVFEDVFLRISAEGRRFFRLCGHSNINKRLIWVDYDHADVRDELICIYKHARRNARRKARRRQLKGTLMTQLE